MTGLSRGSKDYRARLSIGFSEFVNALRHIPPGALFPFQNRGPVLALRRRCAESGQRVTFPIKASDFAANWRISVGQFARTAFGSSKGTSGAFGGGKGISQQVCLVPLSMINLRVAGPSARNGQTWALGT